MTMNNLLLSLLSVLLLSLPWLGFPGYTLFAAFVPLLVLQDKLQGKTNKKGKTPMLFPYVLLTFLLWNIVTVFWIKNATWFGVIVAFAVNTFISTVSFMAYHYVWRRASKALAYTILATAWIGYEFIYINGQISFPWLVLGNGFANTIKSVQWYEYTGVLGGSLWVLITNIFLFQSIKKFKAGRGVLTFLKPALVILVPIITSLAIYYGYDEKSNPISVEVIQPNIDPYHEKFDGLSQQEQTDIILKLACNAPKDVDYIVAPETALEDGIWENNIAHNPTIRYLQQFMRDYYPSSEMIVGATTFKRYDLLSEVTPTAREYPDYWVDVFNSALKIDTTQQTGIYHKSKLVAGAEMIPHHDKLKFLENFALDLGGIAGQLGTDKERSVFVSGKKNAPVGVAICYESIYGEYCTEYIQKGAQALFIITNDGWWGNTPGYRQHFSYARLRAIELRRSIARSANTGISGFINQRGDVLSRTGWDERVSQTGTINLNDKVTLYTKYGDMIGRISCYTFILCALYYVAYRRRKKDYLAE